jgi:hypothetical protein
MQIIVNIGLAGVREVSFTLIITLPEHTPEKSELTQGQ